MTPLSLSLFIFTSIVLCVVPGPDMIFLIGRTIAQGKKAGIVAALGINLGAYVHLLAAISGISVILSTSAIAFNILKWIGALYLLITGIKILRQKADALVIDNKTVKISNHRKIFWQGFLSDVLNPKVAIFYLAFLPQFIITTNQNRTWQLLFLGCTLNVIAIAINLSIVYAVSHITRKFYINQKINRLLNKSLGLLFVALGLRLATEKMS